MSTITRCDHCKQDIISKLPDVNASGDFLITLDRPYPIAFDMAPYPKDYCKFYAYSNRTFHVCRSCRTLFLEFMGVK
jgi:hypothetical protein